MAKYNIDIDGLGARAYGLTLRTTEDKATIIINNTNLDDVLETAIDLAIKLVVKS